VGRYDLAPTVRAYRGSLPSGARGVEFTTEVFPNSPYGPIARWSGPRPGVWVEEEFAKIRVLVTRNTQR
jgi:hypothetical protein